MSNVMATNKDKLRISSKEMSEILKENHMEIKNTYFHFPMLFSRELELINNGDIHDVESNEILMNKDESLTVAASMGMNHIPTMSKYWEDAESKLKKPEVIDYTKEIAFHKEKVSHYEKLQGILTSSKSDLEKDLSVAHLSECDEYTFSYLVKMKKLKLTDKNVNLMARNIIRKVHNPFLKLKGRGAPLEAARQSILRVTSK